MPKSEKILKAQKVLKDKGFDPGPLDGLPGPKTKEAARAYLNIHVSDSHILILDLYRDNYFPSESNVIEGPVIELESVVLTHYTGKQGTFWINADVYQSFVDGITAWKDKGKGFRITEILRTLSVQRSLKKRKPRLAATPGWSMHGHGKAFDFDISSVGNLLEFYRHMGNYGWFNIYSKPGNVILCPRGREAWHLQKTDPVGIKARTYLRQWAISRGAVDDNSILKTLLNIKYKK